MQATPWAMVSFGVLVLCAWVQVFELLPVEALT
jgi:hypothetical protein